MPLLRRLVVEGDSMTPTLLPGDRVVAVRGAIKAGDLVALHDPREPARIIVKRVDVVTETTVDVVGDNPGASTDSRQFGSVPRTLVIGRVVYRYSPPERVGRFRSS